MGKLVKQEADDALEVSEKWPSDFPIALLTTGTIDDDDDPAQERSGENEARTNALEEFQYDDEDHDAHE
jgi:hypothetical protein